MKPSWLPVFVLSVLFGAATTFGVAYYLDAKSDCDKVGGTLTKGAYTWVCQNN